MILSTHKLSPEPPIEALQAVAVPVLVLDARARIIGLNSACEKLLGFTRGELRGGFLWQHIVASEDRERARRIYLEAGPGQMPAQCSLDLLSKNGERIRVSCANRWLPEPDGSYAHAVITVLNSESRQALADAGGSPDIADCTDAEEALRATQRSYEILISNLNGLVYRRTHDENWNMEFASDGCLALTGYGCDDFTKDHQFSWMELVHPDDLQRISDEMDVAIGDQRPFQLVYRIITAGDEQKWVWEQGRGIYDSGGSLLALEGFVTDITEQKRAEQALRESEGTFRRMADLAPVLIWMSDTTKCCNWFNSAWLFYTGRTMEQETGEGWTEGVHPDDLQRCLDTYSAAFDAREDFQLEYRLRRHDGSYGWISDAGIPRFTDDGTFEGYVGYCWDITERVRTAAALDTSERRFRAIFNSTFQFIGLLSPEGTVLEANQAALDFAGLRNEDVVGRPFWETKWWALSPEIQSQLQAAIQEAARGKLVRYEVEHIGDGGKIVIVDFSLKPVLNERGETVLIIPEGRDITERKRAEEEAMRHQRELAHVMRLSTMGEMASGMAHELSQPLMAVASYCETALGMLGQLADTPQGLNDILKRALEQTHRAGDVIRHLRDFVSKGSTPKQLVDVDQLIRELVEFLDWEFHNSKVKVALGLCGQGRKVLVDRVQIEQVLVNLVLNSLEAMQGGGAGEHQLLLQTSVLDDNSIEVTVSDNGPGIDATLVDRIFDPFQTTKHGGMGMGLSISRSIIEAHNGKLWAAEHPERGASFGFSLPLGGG